MALEICFACETSNLRDEGSLGVGFPEGSSTWKTICMNTQ